MNSRILLAFSFLALTSAAYAGVVMDQINSMGSIDAADTFGASQVSTDVAPFNSMVLADVNLTGDTITEIDAAMAFADAADSGGVRDSVLGFRVSVFGGAGQALNSGTGFLNGAIATKNILCSDSQISDLLGTGVDSKYSPSLIKLTGLNLQVGTGLKWIGVAAILDGGSNFAQSFVLRNSNPALIGGPANDLGINPGNGYNTGGSSVIDSRFSNAAYAVTTVPEPLSCMSIAIGILAIVKRRRV